MSESTQTTGVVPAYDTKFEINTTPKGATPTYKEVADLEEMQITVDGTVVEWTPYSQKGWTRRAVTGKKLGIAFKGKRNYGDAGNDYVAGLILKKGKDVETDCKVTMPNGDLLEFPCVINTTNVFGGASTDLNALEFECLSDGEPSFTQV